MTRLIFTNIHIFDGTGSEPYPGEVSLLGNKIDQVVKGNEQIDRTGAKLIDGQGMTLMPGMVEGHAHLSWPTSVERTINAMSLPIEEHTLVTAQNARITLDYGFTSAYSAGSLGEQLDLVVRDMINQGFFPGPRIRASTIEKGAEIGGVPASHDNEAERNISELQNYVKTMAEMGADSIKFLLSSDEGFSPGGSQILLYTEEEAQAIGNAAREAGIWLACHAQASEAVKRALRAGFRVLYHCTYADEEALDMMEAKKDEIFYAPAPGLLYARVHEAQEFGIGPEEAEKMGATSGLALMEQVCPELKKRGVRVLPGGDYGFPYNPVGRNARDLDIFVKQLGFSPTEALVAATKHGGELMDLPVGLIQSGMLADLLLIDGDPTQDVTILQDKERIPMVMKDGEFYRDALRLIG